MKRATPATLFRARMMRLDTKQLMATRHGIVRWRRCGTWDHYLKHPEPFVPGLRLTQCGSGERRQLLERFERDPDPAERLNISRGPIVRCRELDRAHERQLRREMPSLF